MCVCVAGRSRVTCGGRHQGMHGPWSALLHGWWQWFFHICMYLCTCFVRTSGVPGNYDDIYIYIYMSVYICIYIYIYTHTHTHIYSGENLNSCVYYDSSMHPPLPCPYLSRRFSHSKQQQRVPFAAYPSLVALTSYRSLPYKPRPLTACTHVHICVYAYLYTGRYLPHLGQISEAFCTRIVPWLFIYTCVCV
jgi:hypothetical protein